MRETEKKGEKMTGNTRKDEKWRRGGGGGGPQDKSNRMYVDPLFSYCLAFLQEEEHKCGRNTSCEGEDEEGEGERAKERTMRLK